MGELLGKIGAAAAPIIQQYEINSLSSGLTASITAQLGAGSAMNAISEQAARTARTPFNLLLHGETGSGKSFLAGIIHQISACHNGPFVSVQVAAMPEHLVEGQLFWARPRRLHRCRATNGRSRGVRPRRHPFFG
jgi:transcriptional regulator with PAS, ATPase and Fis domain